MYTVGGHDRVAFFFYLLKIFDVSKMAILKCPSVTSRRDKFGHDIKIDIFSGNFGSMVEV